MPEFLESFSPLALFVYWLGAAGAFRGWETSSLEFPSPQIRLALGSMHGILSAVAKGIA